MYAGPVDERESTAQRPWLGNIRLQLHSAETFPEADGGTVSDDPEVWLAAVANTLKKSG